MKAIILSAGEGKRLRPITENIPKPLLPINGKPLLDYWLECCEKNDVSEVLINGHYLSNLMEEYIDNAKKIYSLKINYVYEKKLLGTGGTVRNNYDFIKDEDFFILCHGDNFTDINLSEMISFHKQNKSDLSVALFLTKSPMHCGIVEEMDPSGLILKFFEKPERPKSNIASAAIFILTPSVVKGIPDDTFIDFSNYVLPRYQGKMFGYPINGFNIDIGTVENYNYANTIAEKILL